ncbi:hypothetical protein Pelo_16760 [Pelomyxa schiedti]|nr:hypothetical protein Pelo_16760 [Pelomyxa schiedti]
MVECKTIGQAVTATSAALFAYYSVWVLLVPLLDHSSGRVVRGLGWLVPRSNTLAIVVPTVISVVIFSGLLGVIGVVMVHSYITASSSSTMAEGRDDVTQHKKDKDQ